ncbi:hypothetical protein [Bacillus cereus group sp. BfR-BA-01518]|uniref:hypothetical protein n=1 Tax=Bacillus cereus group sp. BfR-BA-01518 TaxID=2920368 RepID=UPI001F57C812|nr:hypothetical protein [Bacillus cereus group sp. BfR-BA-01518]
MTIEKDLRPIKLLLRQRKGSIRTVNMQEKLYGKDMPQYYVDKRERLGKQWEDRILKELKWLVQGAEACLQMLQEKPPYKDTPTERRRKRDKVAKWEKRVARMHIEQENIMKEVSNYAK